jgi:uncharacterized protein (TIGR02246 family)
MRINLPTIFASCLLASAGALFAANPPEDSPEKTAVAANDKAFEAAYAKGDAKALANFFTEDADYTDEDGHQYSGKAEIEEALKAGTLVNRGAKIAIDLDSVKPLTPDTLVEKGSTTVTSKDGSTESAAYTAILVRKEGKWKISQLIESPIPDPTPHDRLSELDWLIGTWDEADKEGGVKVHSEYTWARGGNFITRNVTVKRGDETTLEGWQITGWDPVQEKIRSWTFDSEGGFSEGYWTRSGQRWLVREQGFTPDGDRITAENQYSKLTDDKVAFESNNRTRDGEPQPGIPQIQMVRGKGGE